MQWAKLHSTARFNLATSGMEGLPITELGARIEDLQINGPSVYGYSPLIESVARRYRLPQECVVSAVGTSLANYLALAGVTDAGDEILIEQPTYDPLLSVARYLGLEIKRFQRNPDRNFAIDVADLERHLTPRTRAIVLCNLHNPSGALAPDSTLRQVAELARKFDAYVVVDEVYREMLFEAQPQSSFHLDPERFVVTNSLTKAYGLSGLRCGWVLAPESLAARIWRLHDIHCGSYAYPAEWLSVAAFARLPQISARMKSTLDQNRKLLHGFLRERDDLEFFWPEYGTIVFPRLKKGNVNELCDLLRSDFDTTVVPGRFFESPDRFRIGVGISTDSVRDALQQLGLGLDKYRSRLASQPSPQ
jgi:aspartate/methionine/tyrosine aminotransferase